MELNNSIEVLLVVLMDFICSIMQFWDFSECDQKYFFPMNLMIRLYHCIITDRRAKKMCKKFIKKCHWEISQIFVPLLTVLIVCKKKNKKSLLLNEVQRESIPTAINRHLSISAIAQSILSTTNCSKCLNRFHLETTKMLLLCCVLNIITRMKSDTILGAFRHHKSACLCI